MGNIAKYLLLSAKEDLDKSVNVASITKSDLDASIERGDLKNYYLARETDSKISQSEGRINTKIDKINEQIANLINVFLPIGIYVDYANGTNPNTLYPGTKWEKVEGRVRVGVSSEEEFNTVNKKGGEKEHTLNRTELPAHAHHGLQYDASGVGYGSKVNLGTQNSGSQEKYNLMYNNAPQPYDNAGEIITEYEGGNQPHNNLQPYITCYMWHRVA